MITEAMVIFGVMIIRDRSFLSRSDTADGHQYTTGADTVRLAGCNGLPIAFRSAEVIRGRFATSRVQSVTAGGITDLFSTEAERFLKEATAPLN